MRRLIGRAWALLFVLGTWGSLRAQDFPQAIVAWAPDPDAPVFEGTGGPGWDRKIRERGWITFDDGMFHLWYTGYNDERSPLRFLGHATSRDGLHWDRDPHNPIYTDVWTEDVCVVKQGGTYSMFAEGKDDIAHMLTSTDRVHWTDHGPLDVRKKDGSPIGPGPYGTPTVWVENGTWFLFYERGDQGVWLATSKDRKTWVNVQDEPVIPRGPAKYDSQAVALNQVIKRGDWYYGFYHANSERPWKDWTTCVARSKDLVHWEKYPGNPIIAHNRSSAIVVDGPSGPHLYTMHPDVRRFSNPAPAKDDAGKPAASQR